MHCRSSRACKIQQYYNNKQCNIDQLKKNNLSVSKDYFGNLPLVIVKKAVVYLYVTFQTSLKEMTIKKIHVLELIDHQSLYYCTSEKCCDDGLYKMEINLYCVVNPSYLPLL